MRPTDRSGIAQQFFQKFCWAFFTAKILKILPTLAAEKPASVMLIATYKEHHMALQRLQRIIRRRELPDYCGLSHSQIDNMIARKQFPAAVKLTDHVHAKVVGWLEADLLEWQRSRLAAPAPAEDKPAKRKPKAA